MTKSQIVNILQYNTLLLFAGIFLTCCEIPELVKETHPISGTVSIQTNSGYALEFIEIQIYKEASCDSSALIGTVTADVVTKQWTAEIPVLYRTVYFKIIVRDNTGYKFEKMTGSEEIPKSGKEDIALSIGDFDLPELISFSFDLPHSSVVYDDETSRYTFSTLEWIADIDALKAVFSSTGKVFVNGVEQHSGVTANDFRQDVVYVVVAEDNAQRSYTIQFDCPQSTGLPVIKIDTKDQAEITSKEIYTKTNIKIIDPDHPGYSFEHTDYKDEIRGRGNSTWNYPKKPYRIKFDKKISLFGYEAAKSWVLLANYLDPTLIMNTVAFELGLRMGLPYTNHYTHVELFLNGVYQGSYMLTEHVQVGKGRVDIDEKEGFFVELDTYYDEEPKFRTNEYDLPAMIKSPEDLEDPAGYNFVKTAINNLETAMTATHFPDNGYRSLIDMNTFVDFLLTNEMVRNTELGHPKSVYMYKDKGDAKISMGPLWDFDWGFGYSGSDHAYFDHSNSQNWKHAFFQRFFDDPVFTGLYKEHWNTNHAKMASMPAFMDAMASKLNKSQALNFKIWWQHDPVDYADEIEKMKAWWNKRVSYLNVEINNH